MDNALAFWRKCRTLARQDFVLLAKIRLLFGLFVGLSACLLRFFVRGRSMTHVKEFLTDIAILIGSLAVVSLGAFVIKLLQAPVKLYCAKEQALLNAERVIGPPESVKQEAVMMCATIREFVADFVTKNGPLPVSGLTPSPTKKIQMDKDQAAWGYRFTAAFREALETPIGSVLQRLAAEGQRDWVINQLLHKALLYPNDALDIAAYIFKLALKLGAVNERQIDDLQP